MSNNPKISLKEFTHWNEEYSCWWKKEVNSYWSFSYKNGVSFLNYKSIYWRVNERNNIRVRSVGITRVNSLPETWPCKPPMNTRSEKLLCCPYDTLEIEFGGYKSYVNSQKTNFQEEFLKKEHSLRSKLSLKKANKYSTKNSITKIETEIEGVVGKVKNPVTVEIFSKTV